MGRRDSESRSQAGGDKMTRIPIKHIKARQDSCLGLRGNWFCGVNSPLGLIPLEKGIWPIQQTLGVRLKESDEKFWYTWWVVIDTVSGNTLTTVVAHQKNLPRSLDRVLPSETGNARTSSPICLPERSSLSTSCCGAVIPPPA